MSASIGGASSSDRIGRLRGAILPEVFLVQIGTARIVRKRARLRKIRFGDIRIGRPRGLFVVRPRGRKCRIVGTIVRDATIVGWPGGRIGHRSCRVSWTRISTVGRIPTIGRPVGGRPTRIHVVVRNVDVVVVLN